MGDNHHEEELKKECPFNGKWCGDWCPLLITVNRQIGGQTATASMCVFVATNLMTSEMNMREGQAQNPAQKIQLPPGFGRG